MDVYPVIITLGVAALSGWAEGWQARRVRRVGRLAFGPAGAPRAWVRGVPLIRVLATAALGWGLAVLVWLPPAGGRPLNQPEGGYRHLILALDVSPSMQLADAGPGRQLRRAQRAQEVLMSVLSRIALDQVRISIVAVYTGARPVVVDTFDLEVVRNIISDLPLDYAFEIGKTRLIDGVRESAQLARPWPPGSTTLIIVSDGDTVPDTGLPELPRAVGQVVVLGVGDPRAGTYIDGHQSRQDVATLRQLASRLRGGYHDVNERHLASGALAGLVQGMPLRDVAGRSQREAALGAVAGGAAAMGLLPLALAVAGSPWQRTQRSPSQRAGRFLGRWRRLADRRHAANTQSLPTESSP